jgi:hypothetical protein
MKENIVNTIRLAKRIVGFGDNRFMKYYLHINCPCKLQGSSYVGTYDSETAVKHQISMLGGGTASSGYCSKNQPLVVENKPKKIRKANKKTRFIQDVVETVGMSDWNKMGHMTTPDKYIITVGRAGHACTSLLVQDPNGNKFEMRRQFTASNAENIAKALWELMKEMAI